MKNLLEAVRLRGRKMRGGQKQNDYRWNDQILVKVEMMGKMTWYFGKFGKQWLFCVGSCRWRKICVYNSDKNSLMLLFVILHGSHKQNFASKTEVSHKNYFSEFYFHCLVLYSSCINQLHLPI